MGEWSIINHSIWRDQPFLDLSAEAKVIFTHSWTHSTMASMAGIDRVQVSDLRRAAGLDDDEQLDVVLGELGIKPFVCFDWERSIMWCVKRLHYNAPRIGPQFAQMVLDHLRRLDDRSPVVRAYQARYERRLREVHARARNGATPSVA